MLFVISPSKDLDYKSDYLRSSNDEPRLWQKSQDIISILAKKTSKQLQTLMDISEKLATENVNRNKAFTPLFTNENSRPAIYAFSGDVYRGLEAYSMNDQQINYCQNHLRILSGLYGLLKPLDLIQPYRLEMGTQLKVKSAKNLYKFWANEITNLINQDVEDLQTSTIVNLASQEYWAAVSEPKCNAKIITIHFREIRKGKLQFVSYTAKKTRGLMVKYAALHELQKVEELKKFNLDHYEYQHSLSSDLEWFFTKEMNL